MFKSGYPEEIKAQQDDHYGPARPEYHIKHVSFLHGEGIGQGCPGHEQNVYLDSHFLPVGRVDVVGGPEEAGIHALNQEKHDPAVSCPHLPLKFHQMFEPPGCHGIRKTGQAVLHKRAVLHFHEAAPRPLFKQEVYAGVFPVFDLRPDPVITDQFGDPVGGHGGQDQVAGHMVLTPTREVGMSINSQYISIHSIAMF